MTERKGKAEITGMMGDPRTRDQYIDSLYEICAATLSKSEQLTAEKVISACDRLYQRIKNGAYDRFIPLLLSSAGVTYDDFMRAAELFSREQLEYKCRIELGEWGGPLENLSNGVRRERRPLGILLHIAAGNAEGLPAFSVIEGLLAGNINILKLPTGDSGLSALLLAELARIEPELKDYIFVFQISSSEMDTMRKLAELADAIVVWGGDEAVKGARQLADGKTRVISWGHKLSFAYVTEAVSEEDLYRLAVHVCETEQALCSSCQGIFVDTDSEELTEAIGRRFFEQLRRANVDTGKADPGIRAKNTIQVYNDLLEAKEGQIILNSEGVSVYIESDSELSLSFLFRNVWVKRLPKSQIIFRLKKHKNHLQTCALLCGSEEKNELAELLARAGVVKITGSDMSKSEPGFSHDGLYPLREYSRIIEIE